MHVWSTFSADHVYEFKILLDRQLASETELLGQVPYCRSFFILVLLLRNI
jgi:hypothetical protein